MKRYDIFAYCGCEDNDINYERDECKTGDWVRFEDANAEMTTWEFGFNNVSKALGDANAEIERLNHRITNFVMGIDAWKHDCHVAQEENKRLRAVLERIVKYTYMPHNLVKRVGENAVHRIARKALGGDN